jgi:cytoskeleton protein RodZ
MSSVIDVADSPTNAKPSSAAPFETPGALLRAAREKAGLTTDSLAQALNLPVAKLAALENDDYEKLASDVFAQGYLRRYGKLLKVDENLLVQRFNEYLARMRKTAGKVSQAKARSVGIDLMANKGLLPAAIFAIAIVIAAVIFARIGGDEVIEPEIARGAGTSAATARGDDSVRPQHPAPTESVGNAGAANEPALGESSSVREESASVLSESSSVREESMSVRSESASVREEPAPVVTTADSQSVNPPPAASQSMAAQPTAAKPTAAQPATLSPNVVPPREKEAGTLAFAFTGPCWVEVTDADGTVIHADLAEAGESLTVVGDAPFTVMLGNARAASLSVNGEPVPVNPHPGNRTAKLTVGE